MNAEVSATGFGTNPSLRGVIGTTALSGAWAGTRAADGWGEIWTGMPPSSGEPQRMRRVMRATGLAPLVTEHLRLAAEHLRHVDYATDLGADIGSTRWWRGLGLMLALSASALAFWPGFAPPLPPAHLRPVAAPADARLRESLATGAAMDADAPMPAPRSPPTGHPQIALATTLADGDSYGEMFQRVGVGAGDAEQVSTLITTAIPMGEIAPGTSFTLSADADGGHALQQVEFRTRSDLVVAIERRGASFELGTRGTIAPVAPLPPSALVPLAPSLPAPIAHAPRSAAVAPLVDGGPLRIRGTVGASLYRSARAAGVPAPAVQQYLRTLGAHMNIADLQSDDTFDIILGNARTGHGAAPGAAHPGDLLYAGLEHHGHARAALVRWGNSNASNGQNTDGQNANGQNTDGQNTDGQFVDASGQSALAAPAHLVMPVVGKITSGFGMRFHPILGFTRMHEGIDLAAPYGAPIYAVASGTVSFAGLHGGHGKFVRLEHSGGLGTGYAHMSSIAVAEGTHVQAGQVIGYVGSTGLSTGAHLHYEVYRDGGAVNPLTVRFGAAVRAVPRNMGALRARLAVLLRVKPRVG